MPVSQALLCITDIGTRQRWLERLVDRRDVFHAACATSEQRHKPLETQFQLRSYPGHVSNSGPP